MENILIVISILIIGSALGETQLPTLPGAVLSFGALFLALFNASSRENMAIIFISVSIFLVVIGVNSYIAVIEFKKEWDNSS